MEDCRRRLTALLTSSNCRMAVTRRHKSTKAVPRSYVLTPDVFHSGATIASATGFTIVL
jgi:hypothetical protein